MEYKLMTREELTEYIYNFWVSWGIPEYEGTLEDLREEIYDSLGTLYGVERELDIVRMEFENGWDENSLEYKNLDKLWNYLNWYKTDLQKKQKGYKKCKYCGELHKTDDEDLLCANCREIFGHAFYSEL